MIIVCFRLRDVQIINTAYQTFIFLRPFVQLCRMKEEIVVDISVMETLLEQCIFPLTFSLTDIDTTACHGIVRFSKEYCLDDDDSILKGTVSFFVKCCNVSF